MPVEPAIALLVVSDDPYVLGGVRAALEEDEGLFVRTGSAGPADDEPHVPVDIEVLVLDVGGESLGDDERAFSGVPTVALVDDLPGAHAAMARGAAGVVHRHGAPSRLRAAVWAVHAGLRVVDEDYQGLLKPDGWRPRQAPIAELTARESEVLELMAQGLSNPEIAVELGVTRHTSKFHVKAILDKLGAQSRTEAVVLAVRNGLLHL